MKNLCFLGIIELLLPVMSYADACADGENAAGCPIATTDITYTLTGYSHINQSNTYLTTSLNISYPFTNTLSAYAGYQYFDSGGDIKMSSGQIGVSGSF